ncbi:MAG: ABC transporter substrate-binding protein, partial [Hyphomicrobiaceae bacterium]|nr:ABC transporter substrate-binding protein [Hyphomicrobiaceae bacterium]
DEAGNRELPQIVGQLTILPKHWWTGTDASGNPRDVARGTLEPPLGSGPYHIASLSPGRSVTYERVADYWGRDLAVNVGTNNFAEIRYEFFRDDTVEFEAFKADAVDWRIESTARVWATGYDFPAVRDGRVIMETFEEPYRASGLMVGMVFNLRRPIFQDPRVRRAFNLVFDFEETNRTLFFGQYERLSSYFHGTELAASGLPEGRELALLEPLRDQLPESVFTTPYANPLADTPEALRANLRQALDLFAEAGWRVREEVDPEQAGSGFLHSILSAIGLASDPTRQVMRGPDGEPVVLEWLLNGPGFERIALAYKDMLARVGIELTIRIVDSSQFVNRLRARDFDIIYNGWAQSLSPGNEQLEYFGCEAARREGSRNYGGICTPAIEALINAVIFAEDREELVAATHALDRALLAGNYLVPGWGQRAARTARWDRFAHPEPLPEYGLGFPAIWWFDEERARRISGGGSNG